MTRAYLSHPTFKSWMARAIRMGRPTDIGSDAIASDTELTAFVFLSFSVNIRTGWHAKQKSMLIVHDIIGSRALA